ncbi:MAG: alanine--tRNA ligase-related protein [Parcubacteria group bacterium]
MSTTLKYLDNTYLFASEAKVLEIRQTEKGTAVVLDETIFYPQGGGQPADIGKISSQSATFTVSDVRLDENGGVLHYGQFETGNFQKGDAVKLEINADRRKLNAKLHSAAHLIDVAVEMIGMPIIAPTKGYHFPEGPYVEYDGEIDDAASYVPKLEEKVNELIAQKIAVEKKNYSPDEAIRKGLRAPAGKSVRTVAFSGNAEVGCGGTHVENSGEIGGITIRKISSKKGTTKVSYQVK